MKTVSCLDLHLEINRKGKLLTKLHNKREDCSFRIINFPFISDNILSATVHGVFISQLIRCVRACHNYANFMYRAKPFTIRLLEQDYVLQKFYGRHHDLVDSYGVSICIMKTDLFNMSLFPFPLSSTLDLTFYEHLDGCF